MRAGSRAETTEPHNRDGHPRLMTTGPAGLTAAHLLSSIAGLLTDVGAGRQDIQWMTDVGAGRQADIQIGRWMPGAEEGIVIGEWMTGQAETGTFEL